MKILIGPTRDWFPTRTEHSTSQLSFSTPRFLWSRGVTSIASEPVRPAGRAQGKLKVLMTTMNSQPDTTQWSRFPKRCLNCCFASLLLTDERLKRKSHNVQSPDRFELDGGLLDSCGRCGDGRAAGWLD